MQQHISFNVALICLIRKAALYGWIEQDSKLYYYIVGILSGSAIFMEDKKRRTELCLYALPKGLHSFYKLLLARNWIVFITRFDNILFSIGTGLLIAFYHHDKEVLSPLMGKMLGRFENVIDDYHAEINWFIIIQSIYQINLPITVTLEI